MSNQAKAKARSQSLHSNAQFEFTRERQQQQPKNEDFTKRVRYLENSLLPNCRRDSMDTILDYALSKDVPLSDSRLSNRSNKVLTAVVRRTSPTWCWETGSTSSLHPSRRRRS
jgi:hypothetical protein